MGFVSAFDTLHNQYEAGLLREEVYISIARNYFGLANKPGAKEILEENIPTLTPDLWITAGKDVSVVREDDFETYSSLENQ